jgi:hypothetical protein
MPNKAKFRNAKNEHNLLFYNNYQQRTMNSLKQSQTKPIFISPARVLTQIKPKAKPNFDAFIDCKMASQIFVCERYLWYNTRLCYLVRMVKDLCGCI